MITGTIDNSGQKVANIEEGAFVFNEGSLMLDAQSNQWLGVDKYTFSEKMVIGIIYNIYQKVADIRWGTFMLKEGDQIFDIQIKQCLGVNKYPISGAVSFANTMPESFLHYYAREESSTPSPLQVIWERKEQAPVVSAKLSEKELLHHWEQFLTEHEKELTAKYKGKYVAIWEDKVYDCDLDLPTLANRVYASLGYRPIFMPYIGKKKSVAEFLSPV